MRSAMPLILRTFALSLMLASCGDVDLKNSRSASEAEGADNEVTFQLTKDDCLSKKDKSEKSEACSTKPKQCKNGETVKYTTMLWAKKKSCTQKDCQGREFASEKYSSYERESEYLAECQNGRLVNIAAHHKKNAEIV